jgi:argininosuccinate lyase
VAGKLHTGRSRNDQVSTDLRLYLLGKIDGLAADQGTLQRSTVDKAVQHLEVVMPGYTHLQQAQPVLFSHWLLSFYWKLERDRARLSCVRERTAVLPLGAGALAGCPFPLDRARLARELGFGGVSENSIDAVGDRDYVIEFLAWAAQLQLHLSGLAEDVVLWATREFGFLRLDDAHCTGSSLMPQKKNPDVFELVRGKSARMIAHLTNALVMVKGLPSGYNKDLQEDKEPVFDAVDTLEMELPVVAQVIASMSVNSERMWASMDTAMLATDLADYLVNKGVPFREAHHLIGRAVRRAAELGVELSGMRAAELQSIHPALGVDALQCLDFRASVERRTIQGGTATASVLAQIEEARRRLTAS